MPAEQIPPITAMSRRHHVAAALRDAISSGMLQPGDRLREPDLAAQFGTSRAPLREALRQLENEGLVVSSPYRGTVVLGISQVEIEEVIVPIRRTLERFALRHALPKLSAADFEQLQRLVDQMDASKDDADTITQADLQFHELLMERAEQPHCLQIWQLMQPRIRAYFQRDAKTLTSTARPAEQHARLLDALRSGDESQALAELDRHILEMPEPPTAD
ncbi:transcriptional regulator, GntR family [Kribbella flavida DSM 17836]|uniref:Transcriptional regulator, GntR family n=1 Tax=Kribbella flavida (strain DSM 17836 / JCM 10339 / NBRC 14399) TaxID=479435 RepID=D2PWR5_KRIFD|nr:GntR family transcriptional regulator [Kribbella flavida]ADB33534.1 transcriptional regulator, GntR family [Kribbella flavida DSM 17836]